MNQEERCSNCSEQTSETYEVHCGSLGYQSWCRKCIELTVRHYEEAGEAVPISLLDSMVQMTHVQARGT